MNMNIEETGKDLLDIINKSRFSLFLIGCIYIGITVISTTDEMLIKQSQVKLPLLDVQIPVTSHFGFHNIAPWLVVLLHGNLLLELALLGMGKKLQSFKESVKPRSFQYIEFITFRSILFLILIILPISILLLIQGRFLALHDVIITWMQRFSIVVDLILLWLLWPGVGWDYDQVEAQGTNGWKRLSKQRFLFGVTGCSVLLMMLMTIPGNHKPEQQWLWSYLQENPHLESLAKWWFQWRNLDLHEKVLVTTPLDPQLMERLRNQEIEEKDLQKIPANLFQGVNMTHANLNQAILPRIDFRAAAHGKHPTQLQGADLSYAKMPGALSDQANLQSANLQGAWLLKAELRKADLKNANLQDAGLQDTNLQGANLRDANLQGANLQGADLRGANLQNANLQGACLNQAKLAGAILNKAKFEPRQLEQSDWNLVSH